MGDAVKEGEKNDGEELFVCLSNNNAFFVCVAKVRYVLPRNYELFVIL